MIRTIINIDEDRCNGCGLCAEACHEGAIGMVDGKARLLRDDYCDGLGNCLPVCPTAAISFETREAAAFDEAAVKANMAAGAAVAPAGGCPGSRAGALRVPITPGSPPQPTGEHSALAQWPVQLKLVPVHAPYFEGADLLVAADCSAFACGDFHSRFMAGKVTLIGCPKLDEGDYSEKLAAILSQNSLHSLTVVRMEVPCCGGITAAALRAVAQSGKDIPCRVVTLSTSGDVVDGQGGAGIVLA